MSLTQVSIPNDLLLFDAASGANLTLVKTFFDTLHQNQNSNMRADGGSIEEGESQTTFGTLTFGIRYSHPRENYANHDRFVIVAENGPTQQFRQIVDFTPQPGDTVDSATIRWINAALDISLGAMISLGLPFLDLLPPHLTS